MKGMRQFLTLVVLLVSAFSAVSASGQVSTNSTGQTPPPKGPGVVLFNGQAQPPKNIQVLKDIPTSDLLNTMWFFGVSLDVSCTHCHVQPNMDSDAKQAKLTAREMIQMTRDLNAANFGGKPVVTCNTCHQGNTRPNGIPSQFNKTPEQFAAWMKANPPFLPPGAPAPAQPAAPEPASVEPLPTARSVYANYRKAVGTTPITSMHFKGETTTSNILIVRGVPTTGTTPLGIEINVLNPDKVEQINFAPGGQRQSLQIANGEHGWFVTASGTTELAPAQLALVSANQIDLWSPLKHVAAEDLGKVTGIEKINDRSYFVVEWSDAKKGYALYFDIQSGLLYEYREDTITAFGIVRSETVFEDYGEVSGVMLPHSISKTTPGGYNKWKFSELQINIPMDPAKFQPPPSPAPK
jgi:hypothetical protein